MWFSLHKPIYLSIYLLSYTYVYIDRWQHISICISIYIAVGAFIMLVTPVLIHLIGINRRKTIWRGKLTAGQEASVGENITSDTAHSFCPGCHNRWHVMQSNGQRRGGDWQRHPDPARLTVATHCNAFDGRRCTVLRLRSIQAAALWRIDV